MHVMQDLIDKSVYIEFVGNDKDNPGCWVIIEAIIHTTLGVPIVVKANGTWYNWEAIRSLRPTGV